MPEAHDGRLGLIGNDLERAGLPRSTGRPSSSRTRSRRNWKASKKAEQSRFAAPIVTEITPAPEFWEAEDYHQQYYEKRGLAASCHTVA
jgi:hypothetical protein